MMKLQKDLNLMEMANGKVGFKVDEVIKLSDDSLGTKNGVMGLWEPYRFVLEVGGRVHFLEEYDASRIPVLFIHGAGGNPQEWSFLIDRLDRNYFQPWVLQYPSGSRLTNLSGKLAMALNSLHLKYRFKSLYVIAHSMGGLVSQAMINHLMADGDEVFIKLFVTLSTPWQGHKAAGMGVEYSPVVIPCWYDMAPDSPFIVTLFDIKWPDRLKYYLLFSYRGNRNTLSENNDGIVTIVSQLRLEAQYQATSVYGYDEDHISILTSREVSRKLNEILVLHQKRFLQAKY